ncbi:hypothetical protein LOC67_22555 [Stieleria sp. JC731]|uniref:hypothetical protein n=1 Tax=Stieleria sp. JC731 TaxID=2894195 RepID=UPI001E2A5F0C|nr:hypothetical protein [Stieleria sp. JC731]MCC9603341.1 hypothetical protein [Stieleria sp. JC731]
MQTAWMATGISLILLLLTGFVELGIPPSRFLSGQLPYFVAGIGSIPVALCFVAGGVVGIQFQSSRVTWIATLILVWVVASTLWISQVLDDFASGYPISETFGIAILIGGLGGSTVFLINQKRMRLALSVVPQILVLTCYMIAIASVA